MTGLWTDSIPFRQRRHCGSGGGGAHRAHGFIDTISTMIAGRDEAVVGHRAPNSWRRGVPPRAKARVLFRRAERTAADAAADQRHRGACARLR